MNIPGVDILYTSKYLVDTTWGWTPFALIFIAIAVLGLVGLIIGIKDNELDLWVPGIFVLILGVVVTIFFLYEAEQIYGTEYNVTITDEVTFTEVAQEYDVIDVNGRLYTLRPHEIIPWEGE